jgi:hypothetical protein
VTQTLVGTGEVGAVGYALRVEPNPARGGQVWAVVTMPAASAVFLSLEQPDGRTVLSRSENAVAGENRYALDAAGLPSGMYWLRVKNGAGETVEVRQVYLY